MSVTVTDTIAAPPERVWTLVTDIDGAAERLEGITAIEVLERPTSGLVGLKWRETRVMFGRSASETMWISAAEPGRWYETEAHNHGAIYRTRIAVEPEAAGARLTMRFAATPVSLAARLLAPLAFLFDGPVRKAFAQDLADIKRVAEQSTRGALVPPRPARESRSSLSAER